MSNNSNTPAPPVQPEGEREQLRSCPFCYGNRVENWASRPPNQDRDIWCVFCHDCSCEGPEALTEKEVSRLWNNRRPNFQCAAPSPAIAPKCIHCGHDKYWSMTGTCGMNMGARATIPRPCGCKCEFSQLATSPRCPKCGYVMCQQFDSRPVSAVTELAIPNGKYICYHCADAQPATPTTAVRAAAEEIARDKNVRHLFDPASDPVMAHDRLIERLTTIITRHCFAGGEGDGSVADGRYCRHHDDDPAHGAICYDPTVYGEAR